jgi:hypothetical protein
MIAVLGEETLGRDFSLPPLLEFVPKRNAGLESLAGQTRGLK